MTEDHFKLVREKILPLFEDFNVNEVLDILHYTVECIHDSGIFKMENLIETKRVFSESKVSKI